MPIGPSIRQMFGPFESQVSEFYRSIFVNLTAFVEQINSWTSASNILEIGCGEGAVAERLVKTYPYAIYTGIDITPRVGRMFKGTSTHVAFKQQSIKEIALEISTPFDLIVICDIMHHIPWELHTDILTDAKKTLKPGGYLVLKDWERSATPIHFLCHFADRYITGDTVKYKSADELQELIESVFGTDSIKAKNSIQPWSNNIAFLVQG